MRFSASVYDNPRQPGVYNAFGGDDAAIKAAVLARLRFDALLTHDDPEQLNAACIVISYADLLDGPLFATLDPDDFHGLPLEILAPPDVVRDSSPVALTLRRWMHDEHGTPYGAPFMLIDNPSDRGMIASAVRDVKNLNVRTIGDAVEVLEAAGLAREKADKFERYWRRWEETFRTGVSWQLTPFPRGPASAVELLQGFHRRAARFEGWSLGLRPEFGQNFFVKALHHLKRRGGRRDAAVVYLDELLQGCRDDEDVYREACSVRALFLHHLFEATARSNDAVPEYSSQVGSEDVFAHDEEHLKRLYSEIESDQSTTLPLHPAIVSTLGTLAADEYNDLRQNFATDIATGIATYRQRGTRGSLETAMERLAREVVGSTGAPLLFGNIEEAIRRYVWEPISKYGPKAIAFVFSSQLGTDEGVEMAANVVLKTTKNELRRCRADSAIRTLKNSLVDAADQTASLGADAARGT